MWRKYSIFSIFLSTLAIGALYTAQRHQSNLEKRFHTMMQRADLEDDFNIGDLIDKWTRARVKMLSDIGPLQRALKKLLARQTHQNNENVPTDNKQNIDLIEWLNKFIAILDAKNDAIMGNTDLKALF